jgi:DNA-binding NtrC family response regulator
MTTTRHLVVVAVAKSSASDALAAKLRASFTVRTAYDEQSLLESLEDSVDVVLLDPDLPGVDPDGVAKEIESRDIYCEVGLLTSDRVTEVPPAAAAALEKTASVEELEHVTARMAARAAYRKRLDRIYELASTRANLVTQADELDEEEVAELGRIENRLDRLRAEVRGALARLDDEAAFEAALKWLDNGE